MQVNPYLYFNGNCEEAFSFYEKVLGAKILVKMKHGEMPSEGKGDPAWADKIIHARMEVGGGGGDGFGCAGCTLSLAAGVLDERDREGAGGGG